MKEYSHRVMDDVTTVCDHAKNADRIFSLSKKLHYNFPDPAKATSTGQEIMAQFRKTRELIKDYCRFL